MRVGILLVLTLFATLIVLELAPSASADGPQDIVGSLSATILAACGGNPDPCNRPGEDPVCGGC